MKRPTLAVLLLSALACSSPAEPISEADPADPELGTARWADLGRECSEDAPAFTLPESIRDSLPPDGDDMNGRWAAISRRVPGGWGGSFYDDDLTIYLVDPTQVQATAEALTSEGIGTPSSVTVRQGRWSFAELYDWYRYVNQVIWAIDGTSFSDIQEATNRLEYGAVDEDVRVRIEEALAELDLPCFLVTIELRGYPVLDSS